MSAGKCAVCTKTVYPLESLVAADKTYHKMCFKCQEPDCGIQLNLKTAQPHVATSRIYCAKHYPTAKATSVTSSVELDRAKNVPKVANVNNQKRGDNMENPNFGHDSLGIQNATNAPKVALVNQQKRGDNMENPSVGLDSMAVQNAANAPKVALVNEQKRGDNMESNNVGLDSMSVQNAKTAHANAQTLVNEQKRGESVPTSSVSLTMENALKAPKVNNVNDQVRTADGHDGSYSQVVDMKLQNAINAPKVDVASPQIRGTGDAPNYNVIV